MKDECSNCKSARVRRSECYCSVLQKIVPLGSKCDDYGRGDQWEVISSDGKTVLYPVGE